MPQNPHLAIENPCTENWDQMTPQQQGRHCHACQKTVVDFTRMDDQEVLSWLARHPEPPCGRFRQDQLQRPLLARPKHSQGPGRYWHYLIALLLSSTEITAQAQPPKPSTHQPIPFKGQRQPLLVDTLADPVRQLPPDSLRGRLMDAKGTPVPFASIKYKQNQEVAADAQGYFSIPAASLASVDTLEVSAEGYEPAEIHLSKIQQDGNIKLFPILRMEAFVVGKVVTVGRLKTPTPNLKNSTPPSQTTSTH